MNILIVRLGALGDIVHAVPAAAALRAAFPDAGIDWLVEERHRPMVDLVTVVDRVVVLERATPAGWVEAIRRLRQVRYDVALDFQGLMKSAVLARASGARRVVGFSIWHLREKGALPFYSETDGASELSPAPHVIHKNLGLLRVMGVPVDRVLFPLARPESAALGQLRATIGESTPFALVNPGAAWPNKRWPAEHFGEVAAFLHDVRGLVPVVLWGPGEELLAHAVAAASGGVAQVAPPTRLPDVVALGRACALMVSGDTGPLHVAAAAGAPVVGIFGPTDPDRNGPWAPGDLTVSRFGSCACHYERRCRQSSWCLAGVPVAEVTAVIQQRLAGATVEPHGRP